MCNRESISYLQCQARGLPWPLRVNSRVQGQSSSWIQRIGDRGRVLRNARKQTPVKSTKGKKHTEAFKGHLIGFWSKKASVRYCLFRKISCSVQSLIKDDVYHIHVLFGNKVTEVFTLMYADITKPCQN